MNVFTCENNLEAILTCIYDAWVSKLGHRNLRLMLEPVLEPELFCDYIHTEPDSEKVSKVIRSIRKKISAEAWQMVYSCAMSCVPEKPDIIYRFLLYGFAYGRRALEMLQEPAVMEFFALDRRVTNEVHHYREFIRFSSFPGDVLVSHISPRSDVLTLTAPYFADRLPSEHWMIIDDNRRTAVVHPKDEDFYLTRLDPEEFTRLSIPDRKDDPYPELWKGFFRSVSIQARENYRCQRNFLPLWMREHMTEFQ